MIGKDLIRKIHALKTRLKWSEEEYREYLMTHGDGFAASSKDLSETEARKISRQMEDLAEGKGVWERRGGEHPELKTKYDDLGRRKGFATPAQLRMIEAMWADVSYHKEETARAHALDWFLFRLVHVQKLTWLPSKDVRTVVEALQAMKKKKEQGR